LTLILQQTKAEPELVNAIKDYVKVHNKTLQEVYAKAVREFIDSFKNIAPDERHPIFYASPSAGLTINLKLPEKLKNEVITLAKREQTSARRLYYTALLRFALNRKLIFLCWEGKAID
jgi:hypothetical protein